MNTTVIVGATSRMAECCARLWVQEGALDVVLVGRNAAKLAAIQSDLQVRNPEARCTVAVVDFESPAQIQQLAESVCTEHAVNRVLIAHGSLPDQAACQTDLPQAWQAMTLNGLSPVAFAEAFASQMQARGQQGVIGVIGSVAGDRGRKSNYVYGAAKGLVEKYVQGLQHRLADSGIQVLLIKPGPTDTPMTAQLKQQGARLAQVEDVAADIVQAMRSPKAVLYTPGRWRWIMLVVRNIPAALFKKINI